MTSLNDEQLLQYGERSKGKVVLITGACQNADVLQITDYASYLRCRGRDWERNRIRFRTFQVSSPIVRQTCIEFIARGAGPNSFWVTSTLPALMRS